LADLDLNSAGAVDAVVHGVRGQLALAPVAGIALEDLDKMVRTTLRATFLINREAAYATNDGRG